MNISQNDCLIQCWGELELVAGLSPKQTEEFSQLLQTKDYRRGELIYLAGDPADKVYFLHQGLIKLYRADLSGRRLTLQLICHPGQSLGIMALAGEEQRTLSAQVILDSRLCAISKESLLQFAEANPTLWPRITALIGACQMRIEEKLAEVVFRNVPDRLANLLLRLGRDFGQQHEGGLLIKLPLTHQELAELIGASREHVTATLKRFVQAKLLSRSRRGTLLTDRESLRQMVNRQG